MRIKRVLAVLVSMHLIYVNEGQNHTLSNWSEFTTPGVRHDNITFYYQAYTQTDSHVDINGFRSETPQKWILAAFRGSRILFIIFGVTGNGLNAAVFVQRIKRGKSPADVFFFILGITDAVFLTVINLVLYLYELEHPVPLVALSHCTIPFLVFPTARLSAQLIAVISFDRFLAIYFPIKFKQWASRKKAWKAIVVLILLNLAINWHNFGGVNGDLSVGRVSTSIVSDCKGRTPWIDNYYRKIFFVVHIVFYSAVPGLAVLVFNILIIRKIRQSVPPLEKTCKMSTKIHKTACKSGLATLTSGHDAPIELKVQATTLLSQSSVIDQDAHASTSRLVQLHPSKTQIPAGLDPPDQLACQANETSTEVVVGYSTCLQAISISLKPISSSPSPNSTSPKSNITSPKPISATACAEIQTAKSEIDDSVKDIDQEERPTKKLDNSKASTKTGRPKSAFEKYGKRITRLCIAASIPFLVMTLAHTILQMLINQFKFDFNTTGIWISSGVTLVTSLNHSLNIVLYCLVSSEFRADLIRILCGKCRK